MALVENNLVGRLVCGSNGLDFTAAKPTSFSNSHPFILGYLAEKGEGKTHFGVFSTGLHDERKRV